jgi:proteasome lid subunit RPN8/RPN11
MPLFDFSGDERAKVHAIKKRTLRMILEAGKSSYPNEFGAMLRAEEGVISELLLIPGTVAGEESALFKLHMVPIDFSVVGTVHTHPSHSCRPSGADLEFFRKYGWVHIIACMPFDRRSWACYDAMGEPRPLEVLG